MESLRSCLPTPTPMVAVVSGGHILICVGVRIVIRFIAMQHAAKLSSVSGLHCAAVMRRRCTASASVTTMTEAIDAVERRKNVLSIALLILRIYLLQRNKLLRNKSTIFFKKAAVNLRIISILATTSPYFELING
ncbi:hypothetical protein [Ensifer aridi]|uniref:hypothetical protein n=1 Tax=Ensifer aridi TaxID=1708715 RepID=UPI0015E2DB18|nr:hypothetical protein [Ensifer aridi]